MKSFRETFSRPVRRVRFLGLFDTVNAVPRFENAWLERSGGFPYTAQSTLIPSLVPFLFFIFWLFNSQPPIEDEESFSVATIIGTPPLI